MKSVPLGVAVVATAAGLLFFSAPLRGQDEGSPTPTPSPTPPSTISSRALTAKVDYGNDLIFYPAKQSTDFERLGLLPNQILSITVQFPAELAGQTIIAESLDGGTLSLPEEGLLVDADGNVTFQFQAGVSFGACRIAVHQPDDSNFIQLWVVDPDHPENTPPGLSGSY
jgi:hypothetical protein